MRSIATVLDENKGLGPGFNFIRLALAVTVMLWHSRQLSYGQEHPWLPVYLIVPAFFGLSGFLVAGSMVRVKDVRTFLLLRVLRIVPALWVEITLSALILGPVTTSTTLPDYFSDPLFIRYFLNLLGVIQFKLPHVFDANPFPSVVNGQLWTIPSELHCYLLLAALMALRVARRRWLMLAAFACLSGFESVVAFLPNHNYTSAVLNAGETLILCFLFGNVVYLFRDRIPVDSRLFLFSIATFFGVAYFIPALACSLCVVSACYAVVYLGMCRLPRIPILMRGDYSYGIYLFSFPLQQAIAWMFPDAREWYFNMLLGFPLVTGYAMLSWHFVEKPALGLRRFFVARPVVAISPAA